MCSSVLEMNFKNYVMIIAYHGSSFYEYVLLIPLNEKAMLLISYSIIFLLDVCISSIVGYSLHSKISDIKYFLDKPCIIIQVAFKKNVLTRFLLL